MTELAIEQTFVVGDGNYDAAVKSLGLYADAKLALTKKLTLTAGLRWDAQWNPQPDHPNAAIPSTTKIPNDLNQGSQVGVAGIQRPIP